MGFQRSVVKFLTVIRQSLVTDVPPEYQVCESCREITCDTARAESCPYRLLGEKQEIKRRKQNG